MFPWYASTHWINAPTSQRLICLALSIKRSHGVANGSLAEYALAFVLIQQVVRVKPDYLNNALTPRVMLHLQPHDYLALLITLRNPQLSQPNLFHSTFHGVLPAIAQLVPAYQLLSTALIANCEIEQ